MFTFKKKIINIRPVTFRNVNTLYGLTEMFLSIAGGKNLVTLNMKKKHIYLAIINQIINMTCDPVFKVKNIKDAIYAYNRIIELTQYEKIREKIEKSKSEYEASNITVNGKTYNSNDYFKSEISRNYMSLLAYIYISEKDFLEIEFLKFEDILKTMTLKDLKEKIFIIDSLVTCQAMTDGKAYKEMRSSLSRQLTSIEESFKDTITYLKDKKEIRSCRKN
jgi:hypothetical protein